MQKVFSYIVSFFSFIFYFCIFSSLVVVAAVTYFFFDLSDEIPRIPEDLARINLSTPTEIYSNDNVLIASFGSRSAVPLASISEYFQNAIVATEDNRFYTHSGIDKYGIARAMYINLKNRRLVQGGSSITQQLTKNLFFSFEKNVRRKILEMMAAVQVEGMFSKDEILQAYCNQIYFGSGAYGVEDASKRFYNKNASDLTLAEASLLAGLPNAPSMYNPFYRYDLAKKRQKIVLRRMVQGGYISEARMEQAYTEELTFNKKKVAVNQHPYFIDYVLSRAEKLFGKDPLYFGGLKIYTTLDRKLQDVAQKNLTKRTEEVSKILKKEEFNIEGAAVGVEPKTGYIKFMVGGKNYVKSPFNRATSANRQPGSGFKPFLYYTAFEKLGYTPATVVRDEEVTFEINGADDWSPQNYEEEFFGDIILKYALQQSVNIISAKLIHEVTPEVLVKNARKFGIKSKLPAHYSLSLGTAAVAPLEMATAYAVFASEGLYAEPLAIKRIENYTGDVLLENVPRPQRVFPQEKMYLMVDMMKGVIENGTGRGAKRYGLKVPAAGKTGTSNNFVDSWFNGYIPDLSVSVWVGDNANKPMMFAENKGITGASGALPIWSKIMVAATSGKPFKDFPIPDGIRFERVNIHTGFPQEKYSKEKPSLKVALTEDLLADLLRKEEDVQLMELEEERKERQESLTDEIENVILDNAEPVDSVDIH